MLPVLLLPVAPAAADHLPEAIVIRMADSTEPRALPPGLPAYLGYADGNWPTAATLRQSFPGAHVVSLTVTGRTLDADGIDCEPGNVNAVKAATWVKVKLATEAGSRPVVYADLASPGYSMSECIAALDGIGVPRAQYRVLTAHYDGEHVCSPARGCRDKDGRVITFTADGTQWTDAYRAPGGVVDMSLLADDFFGIPADWVFTAVRGLTAIPGHTSVLLSWSSPGTPAPGAVHHYQVTVRHAGEDAASYPRTVPKEGNPQSWQGGSLEPGTAYQAMVRAMTEDGKHASPWAAVTFTTGHG